MEESIELDDDYNQRPTFSLRENPTDKVATLINIKMSSPILFLERATFKIEINGVIKETGFKQGFHNIKDVLDELSQAFQLNIRRLEINSDKCEIISELPFKLEGMGNDKDEMKCERSDWSYLGFSNYFISSVKLGEKKYGLISVNTIGNKNDKFHLNICQEDIPDVSVWRNPANDSISFSGTIDQGVIKVDKENKFLPVKTDTKQLMVVFTSIGNRSHYYTLYTGLVLTLYLENKDAIMRKLSLFESN